MVREAGGVSPSLLCENWFVKLNLYVICNPVATKISDTFFFWFSLVLIVFRSVDNFSFFFGAVFLLHEHDNTIILRYLMIAVLFLNYDSYFFSFYFIRRWMG